MGLNIGEGINNLNKVCSQLNTDMLLFNVAHNKLKANIIYFKEPLTFLIGLKDNNAGWLLPVDRNQEISKVIPNEAFKIIKNSLDEVGNATEGEITYTRHTTEPFFHSILNEMKNLSIDVACVPTAIEIERGLKKTKTDDKKFDDEGDKPFFKNWRRNGFRGDKQIEVSPENLSKTCRTFGHEIRKICKRNNITSVWSNTPTPNSLDFISKSISLNKFNEI